MSRTLSALVAAALIAASPASGASSLEDCKKLCDPLTAAALFPDCECWEPEGEGTCDPIDGCHQDEIVGSRDGAGFEFDLGLGALADSSDDALLALHATPRVFLGSAGNSRFALSLPIIFRPGDAPDPWDDFLDFPVSPGSEDGFGSQVVSASDLRIGPSVIVTPAVEALTDLGERLTLGFIGGVGFRYDQGETTQIEDLGRFTTSDSTSPALTYGLTLERRLSPRASVRGSLLGITTFHDEMGVQVPGGERVTMDGGTQTSAMLGLAVGWRPATESRPAPRPRERETEPRRPATNLELVPVADPALDSGTALEFRLGPPSTIRHLLVYNDSGEAGVARDDGRGVDGVEGDGVYSMPLQEAPPVDDVEPDDPDEALKVSVTCSIETYDVGETMDHCGGEVCEDFAGIGEATGIPCICFYDCSVTVDVSFEVKAARQEDLSSTF